MLSVIVPTYNEAGSLPPLVDRLAAAMAGREWELVVVDDGSPDGTADLAERLAPARPVRVLRRAGKAGLASAVIAGMKEARGDILVVMDADLSHPPEVVPQLVDAIDAGADLAVGSRYVHGGATMDWPLRRRIVSRVACYMGSALVPVRDAGALASAVTRLVADAGARARFGAESRRRAISRFDLSVVAEQTRSIYRRLLDRRAAAGEPDLRRAPAGRPNEALPV